MLSSKGTSMLHLLPTRPLNHLRRGSRKTVRAKGVEVFREPVFADMMGHELMSAVTAYTDMHKIKPAQILA